MTTTIITSLLSILCIVIEFAFSREAREKRKDEELDEAFAERNTIYIAPELEHYLRELQEKNRNTTGKQSYH